ncbi:double-strand-specific ribonuclease Pac1 [Schizosaccharomyces japonicus yFS275]|uniref:ribonuclease III n=1 Tax=Schizosaccharomyces japonicus (strain yFS275 / FY16936) TaxID=402676 RepID=B6K723_SCHJY|nr:double-strand-specific ribonuclease Pac1 [Schizosaccharomyces japonicus yFS275]EEB09327.1 double-strand-specific ribonuclease Pac1 [Schizosaccharomyces japonicus yFS275]
MGHTGHEKRSVDEVCPSSGNDVTSKKQKTKEPVETRHRLEVQKKLKKLSSVLDSVLGLLDSMPEEEKLQEVDEKLCRKMKNVAAHLSSSLKGKGEKEPAADNIAAAEEEEGEVVEATNAPILASQFSSSHLPSLYPSDSENEEGEWPPPLPKLKSSKLEKQVFMHISRAYELYPNHSNSQDLLSVHNERLEFLGDSFFNFYTTRLIYERFAELNEGELSKLRSKLVGNETAEKYARLYGFDKRLVLSVSAEKDELREAKKVIADTFEAYLGALALDGQEREAYRWVRRLTEPKLRETVVDGPIDKRAKAKLYHRYKHQGFIEYAWVDGKGGSSDGYVVACKFNGDEIARSWGANQKDAGARAAMKALEILAKRERKR